MSTKDILNSLVNTANQPVVLLDDSNTTWDAPQVNDAPGKNTKVIIRAKAGSGYKGQVEVHYNRLELSSLEPEQGIRSEDAFTPESVLALLKAHTGLDLSVDEVELVVPSLEVGDIHTVEIVSKPESIGWQGTANVALLQGLPPNSDDLYELMQNAFP